MTRRIGIYPGTFDPITNGHSDIIRRALHVVDHLVIGVARNDAKGPLFSTDERVEIVRDEMAHLENGGAERIDVQPFDILLMSFAELVGASVIVRGPAGGVRFRVRVPDGRHERPPQPDDRDRVSDGVGSLSVHLVALCKGDRRARRRHPAFRQPARRRAPPGPLQRRPRESAVSRSAPRRGRAAGIVGWVERSETHQPCPRLGDDGFRDAQPILRLLQRRPRESAVSRSAPPNPATPRVIVQFARSPAVSEAWRAYPVPTRDCNSCRPVAMPPPGYGRAPGPSSPGRC